VLNLRCYKHSAYTQRPTPPLVEEEAPLLNTYMSRREKRTWSWVSRRSEVRNDSAGETSSNLTDRPTARGQSADGKDVRTEAEDYLLLRVLTRQPLVKTSNNIYYCIKGGVRNEMLYTTFFCIYDFL
jgi:hypothetical protein